MQTEPGSSGWHVRLSEYEPKSYENHELTNFTGSPTWMDGKPPPHLHGTAGSSSFGAVGGHLLALKVSHGSIETRVTTLRDRLERATTRRSAPTSYNSCRSIEAWTG